MISVCFAKFYDDTTTIHFKLNPSITINISAKSIIKILTITTLNLLVSPAGFEPRYRLERATGLMTWKGRISYQNIQD